MVVASNFIHLLCFCITHCELIHLCTIMCTQITLTTLIINHPNILFCVCVCARMPILCGSVDAMLHAIYFTSVPCLEHFSFTHNLFSHSLIIFPSLILHSPNFFIYCLRKFYYFESMCFTLPSPNHSVAIVIVVFVVVAEAQHARQKKAKAIKDLCIKMKNFLRQKHYTVCCVQHTTFIFKYII